MLQNPKDGDSKRIRALFEKMPWVEAPLMEIFEVQTSTPDEDIRSRLLNQGIKHAKGRYLAFLDFDDIVYDQGYEVLINQLRVSKRGRCGRRLSKSVYKESG